MIKKITLLVTFLVALFTISFAQDKPLTGIWELKKSKDGQGNVLDVPIGAYKLFTNDGKFSNMRITQNGAILTHGGMFKIDSNNNYIEHVQDNMVSPKLEKLQTKLTFKLSEDGNTLTLEGVLRLDDGNQTYSLYEEWKKVLIYNP